MIPSIRPLLLLGLSCLPMGLFGQPEVFDRGDFELRGPVKSCTVLTDYGEEVFEFDREGRLVKSLTRYSDADYDVTYYRYRNGDLDERRDEVYRNGVFEKQTSFARFYQRDTLEGLNVTEKLVSYDREIQEQWTYSYAPDTLDAARDTLLVKIVRVHGEGVDETLVTYSREKNETTASFFLNGQLEKSVRKSEKAGPDGDLDVSLVKEYFKGTPQKAVEQTRDASGRLLEETRFTYDPRKQGFVKEQTLSLLYNENGFARKQILRTWNAQGREQVGESEFLYQMDGRQPGNWIKKITTPENTFITRRLSYYKPVPATAGDSLPRH